MLSINSKTSTRKGTYIYIYHAGTEMVAGGEVCVLHYRVTYIEDYITWLATKCLALVYVPYIYMYKRCIDPIGPKLHIYIPFPRAPLSEEG